MENNCIAGCKAFAGGEIRHHKHCPNYSESFSEMYDKLKIQQYLPLSDYEIKLEGKQPHRCPICSGNGIVPNGFYSTTSGYYSSTSTEPETCRSCNGSGIVWG